MKNIVLVGFMGTGKTTVGQILAKRLRRRFIDIDGEIETNCGRPVSEIFKNEGEVFFRQQEQQVIKELLPEGDVVVATGGGAVLFAENVANLKKHGLLICLTATPDSIVGRVGTDGTRPLLSAPNREETVARLLQERARHYQAADFTVDTSSLTPDEAAEEIIGFLRRTGEGGVVTMKPRLIGEGTVPLICTPLVAATAEAVLAELAAVLAKQPDIVEWRVDFFARVADSGQVVAVAAEIKRVAAGVPVIFTVRSLQEGGQPIPLTARQAIELAAAVCRNTAVEYVDCELSNKAEDIAYLRQIAHANNTKIIGSFHDFDRTPAREVLGQKFSAAEGYGLDVAKVAVMPANQEDVLTLLGATMEAKARLKIPLISMAMGGYGAVTRMIGGVFGSAVTFAVGQSASAPGQVPIEELRTVLKIVHKVTNGNQSE
jgi:3-dehydroquinate dehydratase I